MSTLSPKLSPGGVRLSVGEGITIGNVHVQTKEEKSKIDVHDLRNISACRFLSNYSAMLSFDSFARKEYNLENLHFCIVVTVYKLIDWKPARWFGLLKRNNSKNQRAYLRHTMANVIYKCFISDDSPTQVCLKSSVKHKIDKRIAHSEPHLFDEALLVVWKNIEQDQLVRFLSSKFFYKWREEELRSHRLLVDAVSVGQARKRGSFCLLKTAGKKSFSSPSPKIGRRSLVKTGGGSGRAASEGSDAGSEMNSSYGSTEYVITKLESMDTGSSQGTPENKPRRRKRGSRRSRAIHRYFSLTNQGKANAIRFYLEHIGPEMVKEGHFMPTSSV